MRLSLDPKKDHILSVDGYMLSVIPNDIGISAELYVLGSHEPLTTSIIKKVLRPGMTCLDVGSNIGYYAFLEARIVGDNGLIVAIEPSPLNFKYLENNLKLNSTKNVSLHNLAVGDKEGEVKFLVSNRSNLSRVLLTNGPEECLTNEQLIRVPMRRLDLVVEELGINRVDLVRMDTEGFEWNIYNGMKETLKKFRPLLLIEIHLLYLGHEKTAALLRQFREDGYESIYYISRLVDLPRVANPKYIENVRIEHIMDRLSSDSLPLGFTLLLQYENN